MLTGDRWEKKLIIFSQVFKLFLIFLQFFSMLSSYLKIEIDHDLIKAYGVKD